MKSEEEVVVVLASESSLCVVHPHHPWIAPELIVSHNIFHASHIVPLKSPSLSAFFSFITSKIVVCVVPVHVTPSGIARWTSFLFDDAKASGIVLMSDAVAATFGAGCHAERCIVVCVTERSMSLGVVEGGVTERFVTSAKGAISADLVQQRKQQHELATKMNNETEQVVCDEDSQHLSSWFGWRRVGSPRSSLESLWNRLGVGHVESGRQEEEMSSHASCLLVIGDQCSLPGVHDAIRVFVDSCECTTRVMPLSPFMKVGEVSIIPHLSLDFLGACIVATSPAKDLMRFVVTAEEYAERGVDAAHWKFAQ